MLGGRRAAVAGVAVAIAAIAVSSALRAQQPSPKASDQNVFRGGVNLVQISVVATGPDGKPVHGLTKDDFTILERGETRPIEGFVEIRSPRPPASPFPATLAKDVSDNVSAKSDRVVVLVVDDLHFAKVTDTVKDVARRVIDGLGDGTSIGLITTSGNFGMEPTTDRARVLQVVDTFVNKVGMSRQAPASAFGRGGDLGRVLGDLTMEKASQDASHMLVGSDTQRKAFIWISGGLPFNRAEMCPEDAEVRTYWPPTSYEHRCYAMLYELQRANVSIYAADPEPGGTMFLQGLTDETGGLTIRSNNLGAGLDRIIDDLNNYYLLGFSPPDPHDTRYREIDVRVNRPGVSLRYRRGYTAATPLDVNTPKNLSPTAALVAGVLPKTDLQLRLTATPLAPAEPDGTSPLAITLEVHGDSARFLQPDGWLRDTLKYGLTAVDLRRKKPAANRTEQRDIGWQPPTPAAGDVAYAITTELALPPGRYQLRVSGESAALGTSGSVYLVVDVPDTRALPLALGGLLIGVAGDARVPTIASGDAVRLPFLPTLTRDFAPSETLRLLAGFSRGKSVGDVDLLIELVDATDRAVRQISAHVAPNGPPKLDAQLPLRFLSPGAYRLRATATAGEAHDMREVGITIR